MAKWRKKPAVIEAEVFKPGMEDGVDFRDTVQKESNPQAHYVKGDPHDTEIYPFIRTLEGKHYIAPGDYIITGVQGERYPCKPDIFSATYEPA
jgi:hypothetical protein